MSILAIVAITTPGNTRVDSELTEDTKERHGMTGPVGSWSSKLLLPSAYAKVNRLKSKIYYAHSQLTFPWSLEEDGEITPDSSGSGMGTGLVPVEGMRMLPTAWRDRWHDARQRWRQEWREAKSEWLALYPTYIQEAKAALNGAFRENLYPTAEAMASKFTMVASVMEQPKEVTTHNFLTLENQTWLRHESERLERSKTASLNANMRRALEPVIRLARALLDDKPKIYESLVDSVKEAISVVPELATDSRLVEQSKDMLKSLENIDPETLRTNPVVRMSVAVNMAKVVDRFGKFGRKIG